MYTLQTLLYITYDIGCLWNVFSYRARVITPSFLLYGRKNELFDRSKLANELLIVLLMLVMYESELTTCTSQYHFVLHLIGIQNSL